MPSAGLDIVEIAYHYTGMLHGIGRRYPLTWTSKTAPPNRAGGRCGNRRPHP
jgi:hypothetical protein